MILFAKDWARFPSAYPDFNTTNRSFIRLAQIYKSMGVKNHTFILALVNPALQGVDPFDVDNLSEEQKVAIAVECSVNPWYFFREVARAPAESGSGAVPLQANRGNIALFWTFFNHILIFLIQIRQTGKSFSTDTLMTLLLNFICRDTKINLLTKNDDLRRKNIQRLKDIAEELPPYLRQKTRDDANNGEEMSIKSLGNWYNTHVPQASEKRALLMGRGLTSAIFHIDEAPFQDNIRIALKAALPATGAARDSAKAAGAPYGTIITTTAGKIDDKDGAYVYNLLMDAAVWDEKFLDAANLEDLEKMVRANSRGGKLYINATFNHRQLGKSDEWLAQKLEDALQEEGEDTNRDYFNMWTSGSQTNPLDPKVLEAIGKSAMGPLYTSISRPMAYLTRWYLPEHEIGPRLSRGKFVLGFDGSNGSGGDDLTIVLQDLETLEVIAGGSYNELNLIHFSKWLSEMLISMPNVTFNPENKSSGTYIIDYLIVELLAAGQDPFRRIFNTVVDDYQEKPEQFAEINMPLNRRDKIVYEKFKKSFGFTTAGAGKFSREDLYSIILQRAARDGKNVVRDRQLTGQILALINRNGRINHPVGGHDDMVIAWLMCNWFAMMAKNVAFYGIDSRKVMSKVIKASFGRQMDQFEILEQAKFRERMEELNEMLGRETDDAVTILLEREMRVLERKLVATSGEVLSVDELIRQAAEKRRNGKSANRNVPNSSTYGRSIMGQGFGNVNQNVLSHGVMSDRVLSMKEMLNFR